ncbi:hypothetical protein R1sor_008469 [Riccia sorocarpa]|uniref:Uncharacterized protein n=1 Tax=Riccia sorocarpa TaxID=122646 RepID=A0ABD3HTH9_9MARC
MACFSRKRKGKGKLSDLPEEAEEGELMAQTPFTSRPKMLGKKSDPNVPIGVPGKFAENYDMWLKSPQFDKWTLLKEAQPELRNPGNCFVIGVRDLGLAKTLGAHDVVFYVTKRMLTIDRWRMSGHAEAVREMSAFPISHPAICAPVGGLLDDESPTLLFPWWNGGQISHWITRERELRWTRTANGLRREPPSEDVMARYNTDTHLSVEIFRKHRRATGTTTRISMTTVNIANRIDHRRTAAHWETYFQEQLMVDPLVCQRPPETKPRQKKHPDGPREIGKDKL